MIPHISQQREIDVRLLSAAFERQENTFMLEDTMMENLSGCSAFC